MADEPVTPLSVFIFI